MTDEQREQGRDAGTPADAPRTDQQPRTDQHRVEDRADGDTGHGGPPWAARPEAAQPGPAQSGPAQHWSAQPWAAPSGYDAPTYASVPGHASSPAVGPATTAEKPRRQRAMAGIVGAALLAGVVGGGAGFGGAYLLLGDGSGSPALSSAPSTPVAAATPGTVAGAAAVATPSTVDIRVTTPQGVAEGSGVVLTEGGAVLTNNHVVTGGGGPITVTLADGTEHPARVLGSAPSYDLAVLQVEDVSGLTPAMLGNSEDVRVGQQVVAIGSPQGLSGTVTAGIVSAFDRTVTVQGEDGSAVVYNGLQTDAPINQGNSGGPLVDLQGRVIGINSAIATTGESAGSIGLGFAIPVDQAKRVAQEILDSGTATKPVLGVQGDPGAGDGSGAPIAAVSEGSAAAAAGLAPGDVVTRVDDAPVQSFADLIARIGARAPGEGVTLTVTNGGAERTVDVTLGSTPDVAASTTSGGPQGESPFGGEGSFGNPFGGN